MKKFLILTVFLLTNFVLKAQEQSDSTGGIKVVNMKVNQVAPEPPEGFFKFLSSTIQYPKQAPKQTMAGKVYVEFMVDADGRINKHSIKIMKGVHKLLDEEVKRVIALSPTWKPGTLNGKPKPMRIVLPVSFK